MLCTRLSGINFEEVGGCGKLADGEKYLINVPLILLPWDGQRPVDPSSPVPVNVPLILLPWDGQRPVDPSPQKRSIRKLTLPG
jgi:hypothetical protein